MLQICRTPTLERLVLGHCLRLGPSRAAEGLFQKRLFIMVVTVLLRIVLIAIVVVSLDLANTLHAAGPVLYQNCQLTWNANTESNLGGYRAYFGQIASQLNQVKDVGRQTNVRCSDAKAAANGQWYVAV